MKDILMTIAVMGLVVTGACGAMAVPGHSLSAGGGASGIVGPCGLRSHLASYANDYLQTGDKLFPTLFGVGVYAQADDDENGNGEQEKREEEAPPVPSVDRVWDIVMSA